ncbi:MAG: metallophosphoesterase family protein [Nocardioidaceae bacterium]
MRPRIRTITAPEWRTIAARTAVLVAMWTLVAIPAGILLFTNSSTQTVIASHEAVVSPTFDGYATLDLGPYLPNMRYPTDSRLGADIKLGATNLTSYEALIARYSSIGSQPEGEIAKLRRSLGGMAVDSALSAALIGLSGPALWMLLGARRRSELLRQVTVRRGAYTGLTLVVLAAGLTQPWNRNDDRFLQDTGWDPVTEALPDVPIPAEAQPIEVEAGLMTTGTKRIAESLFDSYARSLEFYKDVLSATDSLSGQLRQPEEGQTVAVLVSDRHDNVRMDKVARAIADQVGATVLLDAGDDTSTGSEWEAFSLDSLDQAFRDYDHRYAVAGNHDHGDFVADYLDQLGFTNLDGEAVDGPDGIRLLGANDPRSSGLGTWRDEVGLSFEEHAERLADAACEYDEQGDRISTLLVHDAKSGKYALDRGCVDLVLGGHIHAQLGPTPVTGENGRLGYTYTNGTTGGAAYAIAVGSKLRRDAQVTLVTYEDGRPVGLQPVTVRTVGDFNVGDYTELDQVGETATEHAGTDNDPSGDASP